MTQEIILAAMLLLVPAEAHRPHGESVDDANGRYGVVAAAVGDEAKGGVQLVSFLLAVARHESDFRKSVHSGKVKGDRGWSHSLWQLRCGPRPTSRCPRTKYIVRDIVGVDLAATRRGANAAAGHLRRAVKACQGRPECVFKYYGGVSKTTNLKVQGRIDARVKTYRRLRAFFASRATR